MGPKKGSRNDFYYFMQEQMSMLRREGYQWKNMDELVAICSPRWKMVSENERARYKAMAKQAKEGDKGNLANKFDAQGRNLLDIQKERSEADREHNLMIKTIKETVKSLDVSGLLPRQKFYFIHFNILCETTEKTFLPCEMALAEYSIEEGLSKFLHTFMKPKTLPIGSAYMIQKNAEKTHGLLYDSEPLEAGAAKNWDWILAKMFEMLSPDGGEEDLPPLYALEGEVEKTRFILDDMLARSDHQDRRLKRNSFKVYQLHQLFFHLLFPSGVSDPNVSDISTHLHAQNEIERDYYSYSAEVACPYHDWADKSAYCSLMFVKRWSFIISSHVCPEYGVGWVPGRHCPAKEKLKFAPSKKTFPPIVEIYLCPLKMGQQHVEVSCEPEMMQVKKTRAPPAGYSIPVSANETLFAEKKASSLFSDWGEEYQSAPTKGIRKNIQDVEITSSFDDWVDEPDAVPFKETQRHPNPAPNQPQKQTKGWGSFSSAASGASGQSNAAPSLADTCDFPPLGGWAGPRREGQGRGVPSEEPLPFDLSRMRL